MSRLSFNPFGISTLENTPPDGESFWSSASNKRNRMLNALQIQVIAVTAVEVVIGIQITLQCNNNKTTYAYVWMSEPVLIRDLLTPI